MPKADVVFYREADGRVPVLDWLRELRRENRRAFARCVAKLRMLAMLGHELRRPHADVLRDGIRELRARQGRVHYRILYFPHGRDLVVLAHGLTKEGVVPPIEIERALVRKQRFQQDSDRHTAEEDLAHAEI